MKIRRISAVLAVLILLCLPACGKTETAAPVPAVTDKPVVETEPETVPAEDSSLAAEMTDDVTAYLASLLAYQGSEELIPYMGDMIRTGFDTPIDHLYGFCTRSGKLVTEPVFSSVSVVRNVNSAGTGTENLYLCTLSALDSDPVLFTRNGTLIADCPYEELPQPVNYVYGRIGNVVDDGFYYLGGYTLDENGYAVFVEHQDACYDICRKSDGTRLTLTESLGGPELGVIELGGDDRLYCTLLNGICTTFDKDFNPIVKVPALHSMDLFDYTWPGEAVSYSPDS
jgi:hypothetical protein